MLELVELHRSMSVSELSKQFAVSEETIRRDIKQLESAGRVEKIHGGVRLPATQLEPPYWQRVNHSAEVKKRIGLKAAEQVQDDDTFSLSGPDIAAFLGFEQLRQAEAAQCRERTRLESFAAADPITKASRTAQHRQHNAGLLC